jgi:Tfp pilus assembly protein PilF
MAMTMFVSGIGSHRCIVQLSAAFLLVTLTPTLTAQPFRANDVRPAELATVEIADVPVANPPAAYQPTPEEIGDLDMLHNRYQAAIEAYHQGPLDSATIWNKIGIANQQMFLLEEAKKSYGNALKLNPSNPEVLNNLGTIYYSQKQYGQAERFYRRALKLDPKSALIYKNLGTDLLARDKFKKAWNYYQTALSLDPHIFEHDSHYKIGEPAPLQQRGAMNYFLARSYARAGLSDRAIEYLNLALDEGYADRKMIMADKDLASLHELLAFNQLFASRHADIR